MILNITLETNIFEGVIHSAGDYYFNLLRGFLEFLIGIVVLISIYFSIKKIKCITYLSFK